MLQSHDDFVTTPRPGTCENGRHRRVIVNTRKAGQVHSAPLRGHVLHVHHPDRIGKDARRHLCSAATGACAGTENPAAAKKPMRPSPTNLVTFGVNLDTVTGLGNRFWGRNLLGPPAGRGPTDGWAARWCEG